MKKLICMLLSLMMVISCLAACGGKAKDLNPADAPRSTTNANSNGDSTSAAPTTVTAAITAQWTSLSPYTSNSQTLALLYNSLYDVMVAYDSENNIIPMLAESWFVSDDGLVYTVKIREGVKWHDGVEVDAYDIEFSAELNSNPDATLSATRSSSAYYAGTDATGASNGEPLGVVALDAYTVQYTLKQPIGENMLFGSMPPLVPKHLLEGLDVTQIDTWEFWDHPIGCGPWMYESDVLGTELVLVANPDYYMGKPAIDHLVLKFYNPSELLAGLMSGDIDFCGNGSLPLADFEMAKTVDGITTVAQDEGQYCYMTMDLNCDYLKDPDVRRAFEMAIDKQYMLNSLYGGYGEVIATPYSSACAFIDPSIQSVYDPDAAKQLLIDAGWDFDRVLLCAYSADRTGLAGGAPLLLQQMLGEIGVKVELYEVDYTTMMTEMHDGHTFDFSFMGGSNDVKRPYFAASQYNPDVYWQWSHLADYRYYDVLSSTLDMTDFDDICAAYRTFQNMQMEDPPYIWIAQTDSLIAYNSRIQNVEMHSSSTVPWNTWEWIVNG